MNDDYDEHKWFFERRTDKSIFSKSFDSRSGRKMRIVSHIIDGQPGIQFATVHDSPVLRRTKGGRYSIKAAFFEDDRSIQTLTIQKFNSKERPSDHYHFSFVGSEIDALLRFVAGIKTVQLPGAEKLHLPDDVVRDIVLDQGQARQLFGKNPELFLQLAQSEDITRDLIAVGYRRKQLAHFDRLLNDEKFFAEERTRLVCKPEEVWQKFFEANPWIFGYGLSYHFLSSLDDRKLEQIVKGHDLTGAGKRADALMKTRGLISSLCFVEIKRHDTPLLAAQHYRPDTWAPHSDLVAGVAQAQATVHGAIRKFDKLLPANKVGDPTGEVLFNVEPHSCLVVGNLSQFMTDRGINESKYRAFQTYRRNTWKPEILTFDELLERARFIVDHGENDATPS